MSPAGFSYSTWKVKYNSFLKFKDKSTFKICDMKKKKKKFDLKKWLNIKGKVDKVLNL